MVAVIRSASGCWNGELNTMPAVYVSPFSLSRFGLPANVSTPPAAMKLFGSAWKFEEPLLPHALICAEHRACSFARSGLLRTFDLGSWAAMLVVQGSVPIPVSCELTVGVVYS